MGGGGKPGTGRRAPQSGRASFKQQNRRRRHENRTLFLDRWRRQLQAPGRWRAGPCRVFRSGRQAALVQQLQRQTGLDPPGLERRQKTNVGLPPLTQDAVSYIAQNPAKRDEYAIATFERNVYVSKDQGKTWTQIANRGQ